MNYTEFLQYLDEDVYAIGSEKYKKQDNEMPKRMNYSKFVEEIIQPEYQIEGKTPKCKKGYRWDKNIGGCVPIGSPAKEQNKENPTELGGYNVIGSNGMDGGYALAEPPTGENR